MLAHTDCLARRSIALIGSTPIFVALGNTTPMRLVATVCSDDALSIAQLTNATAMVRQALTKHLHAFADTGLVHNLRCS